MKRMILILVVLFASGGIAQTPARIFHGIKMGASLSGQFPKCKVDSLGSQIVGDPTEKCWRPGLEEPGNEEPDSAVAQIMVGGELADLSVDPGPTTFVELLPGNFDNGTIEYVQLSFPASEATINLSALKQKYGVPTSCFKTGLRNGIGNVINQTTCKWRLSWGELRFRDLLESGITRMDVTAWTNRWLKFHQKDSQTRTKQRGDQF